jgi:hypothetical protein
LEVIDPSAQQISMINKTVTEAKDFHLVSLEVLFPNAGLASVVLVKMGTAAEAATSCPPPSLA